MAITCFAISALSAFGVDSACTIFNGFCPNFDNSLKRVENSIASRESSSDFSREASVENTPRYNYTNDTEQKENIATPNDLIGSILDSMAIL